MVEELVSPPEEVPLFFPHPPPGTPSTHHFVNTAFPQPVPHTKVITNQATMMDAACALTDCQGDRRFALRQRHRPVAVARPRLELPAHHHGGRVGAGGRSIQHSTRPQRPQREAVVVGQQRHPVTVLGGVVEGNLGEGGPAGGCGGGGGGRRMREHSTAQQPQLGECGATWAPCDGSFAFVRMGYVVLLLPTPAVGCKGWRFAGLGYICSQWLLGGAFDCLNQTATTSTEGASPPPSCAPPPGG